MIQLGSSTTGEKLYYTGILFNQDFFLEKNQDIKNLCSS